MLHHSIKFVDFDAVTLVFAQQWGIFMSEIWSWFEAQTLLTDRELLWSERLQARSLPNSKLALSHKKKKKTPKNTTLKQLCAYRGACWNYTLTNTSCFLLLKAEQRESKLSRYDGSLERTLALCVELNTAARLDTAGGDGVNAKRWTKSKSGTG